MSQKTAKAARKVEEAKHAESVERQQAFIKEVQALSAKYRVDMIPVIHYKNTGIVPAVQLVDVKDNYEKLEGAAKEAEMKKQAQNGKVNPAVPPVDAVPKLEL